jgi:MFS family permease
LVCSIPPCCLAQRTGGCAGAGAVTAWGAPNYETLVLGRVLYGLAIGFGMHAAPAYISETVRIFNNIIYSIC